MEQKLSRAETSMLEMLAAQRFLDEHPEVAKEIYAARDLLDKLDGPWRDAYNNYHALIRKYGLDYRSRDMKITVSQSNYEVFIQSGGKITWPWKQIPHTRFV